MSRVNPYASIEKRTFESALMHLLAAIPVLGLFHLSALHISPSGEIQ
jgi:hypothetical protein